MHMNGLDLSTCHKSACTTELAVLHAGSMAPNANCPLVVRFCPKALGQHEADLSVQVLGEVGNKIVYSVPFKALGVCRQVGPHKTLPGGPNALPENFARPKQFVDPDKVTAVMQMCSGLSCTRRRSVGCVSSCSQ